jgi:hypothetical protein
MAEIVYILVNEAMPGLVKVGHTTTDDLAGRIRALSGSTSVPLAFELFYACEVENAHVVERALHDAFDDHRVSKRREFFRIAPERVKSALSIGAIREVTVGDDVFETPEDKADVESAKRRSRFEFAMIGIKPGTELQLERDRAITCRTVDEKNKVEFRGEVTSLSDAALQALQGLGYDWAAVSGPWAWTYHGKRLDDIRREIEEEAD